MDFPRLDFDRMNETDVREEVLAPLLRHLGYRSGGEGCSASIIREQLLRYPNISLGRKKPRDPPLRGKADYICVVDERVRWAIEAKGPNNSLDEDAIDQAYTYASHPEVRAVYFVLCNGRELAVFKTNEAPDCAPILQVPYESMSTQLDTIANVLSPDSLRRDHPEYELDIGKPIGLGLRSLVRILDGHIAYRASTLPGPIEDLTTEIVSGAFERNGDGQLEAWIETRVAFQSLQRLNEQLGLSRFLARSQDEVLSNDPKNPSIFRGGEAVHLPRGFSAKNFATGQVGVLPIDIDIVVETEARVVLDKNQVTGPFLTRFKGSPHFSGELSGTFVAFVG